MNDFRLLAIRPVKGCNKRFLKNLKAGQIYSFYNSWTFYNIDRQPMVDGSGRVQYISEKRTMPANLYNSRTAGGHDLKINISAIAGKNGSGKSTLIELFFAAVYLFSVNEKLLNPNVQTFLDYKESLESEKQDLKEEYNKLAEKRREIKNLLILQQEPKGKSQFFDELKSLFTRFINEEEQLEKQKVFINEEKKRIKNGIREIQKFGKELKAEIYFEVNSDYYCLAIDYDRIRQKAVTNITSINQFTESKEPWKKFHNIEITPANLANYFFYTIAVNYSHYALNSFYLGDWVKSLFHKNDGYTTPIVINPMRTNGNFKIISEIEFAKYRLLTNILKEFSNKKTGSKIYITENQFIFKVKLVLNRSKIKKIPKILRVRGNKITSKDLRSSNLFQSLMGDYLTTSELIKLYSKSFSLKEIIANYILHKVERIAENYPWFGAGYQFSQNTPFVENDKFLKSLKEDESHITYKLKQAINFLKYKLNAGDEGAFFVKEESLERNLKIQFDFDLGELMDWMGNPDASDIISSLPPPVFDIDFELSNKSGSKSFFSELSSGEQQLIHSIQSVIYHLNNLQSAHYSENRRTKYQFLNIVYDEIELYFHPEYQRRFISELLKAIEKFSMDAESKIKAINILFLTHSPFILSDIPSENIMLLDLDEKTGKSMPLKAESQTFAANINDLLADSFFLKGTLIGAFAEGKIRSLIERTRNSGEICKGDINLIEMVGDSFLKSSLQNFLKQYNDKNTDT